MREKHYYVFQYRAISRIPFYERTCGIEEAAQYWVGRLGTGAFYTTEINFEFWY